jgi:hypothetical protein
MTRKLISIVALALAVGGCGASRTITQLQSLLMSAGWPVNTPVYRAVDGLA